MTAGYDRAVETLRPREAAAVGRREWLAGGVLVLLVVGLLGEVHLWRPGVIFRGRDNPQIGEAEAWWRGELALPERYWDTALYEGRAFSHFPPMFSIVAAGIVPFFSGVPHTALLILIGIPIPLLAYALFTRLTGSVFRGVVLALALVCGTSLWPVMERAVKTGGPWFVNQALGSLGLLLFLFGMTGRRWGLAGAGLAVSALSRQLTVFYFPALFLSAMRAKADESPGGRKRLAGPIVAFAVAVGLPLVLNTLKFGRPPDSGYMRIYEGRNDALARDARAHGIFSPHYVPRNLYYANLGFPERIPDGDHWRPNAQATGIWWTTPILLWLIPDVRRLWSQRESRVLLLCCAAVYTALLCYHSTGYAQRGYNRYSLDYLPVVLALIGPGALEERRKWVSVGMIAWSVAYFGWLI